MKVNVYLGAPILRRLKRVRRVSIQDAATGNYIFDAWVACKSGTPDSCYVIEGTVTYAD